MPRDGSNIYNPPFPPVVAGTTISSGVYNGFVNDVALDLNTPRPIVAGGTAATSGYFSTPGNAHNAPAITAVIASQRHSRARARASAAAVTTAR